jgi:hypothetical protein
MSPDLLTQAATFVGLVLLAFLILTLKSWEDGYIRDWLDKRQSNRKEGQKANRMVVEELGGDIQEIKSDVKETKQTAHDVEKRQERMERVIVTLHEQDPHVDGDALRDKMGVDSLPSDILDKREQDYHDDSRDRPYYGGGSDREPGGGTPHGDVDD